MTLTRSISTRTPQSRVRASVALLCGALTGAACADDGVVMPSTLQPADVSFLIAPGTAPTFGADTVAGHGALLPRELFDRLPALTRVDEPDALYAQLDVVGVRLDPCFVEGAEPTSCAPQVRLVLQPVIAGPDGTTTRDATVHLFYAVPVETIDELAAAFARWRQERDLGAQVGVLSEPADAITALLPHLGEARLSRITFVSVHASGQAWTFGGFDVDEQGLTQITPPGVDEHEQHLTSTGGLTTLDATILPPPLVEPAILPYLDAESRSTLDPEQTERAEQAIERLLDPESHNPGTVDCASCHMATAALQHIRVEQGAEGPGTAYSDSQNQRMFGYYGMLPSVSPRVVAETEHVLEFLNARR